MPCTKKGISMSNIDVVAKTNINQDLKEPPLFKIIYLNDNNTTIEFVIASLIQFFDYTVETATKITHDIHEAGSAVVAILPYEIAEQKGVEVTVSARASNMPLQVKIEPEIN